MLDLVEIHLIVQGRKASNGGCPTELSHAEAFMPTKVEEELKRFHTGCHCAIRTKYFAK
jgi:hypothetical protein